MGPRGQEPNESTDDAVWQDLVARLEGTPADSGPPDVPPAQGASPVTAKGPHQDEAARRRPEAAEPLGETGAGGAGLTDRERADAIFRNQPFRSTGPRDYSPPDGPEDDEGFVPEEPPPLGTGDPLTVLAWIGAAGGPILLLLFAMFWRDAPLAATLGVLALFLAGAGYLVTKLPKHRDIGDDGAEV
ncbi:hypothetical protein FDK12_09810 [Arthrobacter sp. NamB2]|uniref:hypothetical protein n=1 Tax=Arthrobacter sp. NamB2 TaxID=2576035 RepID=UPI0010C9DB24|nr:hypothetical protein [Arthrobacter sp. NamB2]TKV28245.1 hypothetical protein FDK12_09810 [Arthrobacter sp. NamB2]